MVLVGTFGLLVWFLELVWFVLLAFYGWFELVCLVSLSWLGWFHPFPWLALLVWSGLQVSCVGLSLLFAEVVFPNTN